ncbi:hypothetical protein cyc_01806 [Cyclospora cayetanensis]|uniref:Uncharacterized protein n=1 Tax=Cyclospora cayetanensis TaxID=88456 RepID=A0A1D3D8H4_9EIME|nr:hypothetical protein cyc_01806 [Cyclospora cayetanensis]
MHDSIKVLGSPVQGVYSIAFTVSLRAGTYYNDDLQNRVTHRGIRLPPNASFLAHVATMIPWLLRVPSIKCGSGEASFPDPRNLEDPSIEKLLSTVAQIRAWPTPPASKRGPLDALGGPLSRLRFIQKRGSTKLPLISQDASPCQALLQWWHSLNTHADRACTSRAPPRIRFSKSSGADGTGADILGWLATKLIDCLDEILQ